MHSAMKHANVLEFLNAVIVEPDGKTKYFPGIYMLLELASGGDLFDKIGARFAAFESSRVPMRFSNQLRMLALTTISPNFISIRQSRDWYVFHLSIQSHLLRAR